jgi:hypothetical protein
LNGKILERKNKEVELIELFELDLRGVTEKIEKTGLRKLRELSLPSLDGKLYLCSAVVAFKYYGAVWLKSPL